MSDLIDQLIPSRFDHQKIVIWCSCIYCDLLMTFGVAALFCCNIRRCVGESWPLSLQRAQFESDALKYERELTKGRFVPAVLHFDDVNFIIGEWSVLPCTRWNMYYLEFQNVIVCVCFILFYHC